MKSTKSRVYIPSAVSPLHLLTCKQKVGTNDAEEIQLKVLIHFDAAKRGQCTNAGVNFLTTHLIIASYIAMRTRSKRFHELVTAAYAALGKASDRPTKMLDLTTGEYQVMRRALAAYLGAMPDVEIGVMAEACAAAEKMMA